MKGNLRFIILKDLEQSEHSGYSLMKHISEHLGRKPSPGSVYPILDELLREKLVTVREEGRSKIYSITAAGKQEAKSATSHRAEILDRVISNVKMVGELCGENPDALINMLQSMKSEDSPFMHPPREMIKLRDAMFRAVLSGAARKSQQRFDRILRTAREQIEALA